MATIIAHRLMRDPLVSQKPNGLYTYGSPRVGDSTYVADFIATGLQCYRFVHKGDVVARLPPWPFYSHIGESIYINRQGKINKATRCERFTDLIMGLVENLFHGDFGFHDHCKKAYVQALQRWTTLEGDVVLS